jgi:two-component system chemotaxis sensor kinase CheA
LSVDTLLNQAEVVVKPAPAELSQVNYVSGATILGDGRVALILDPSQLYQPSTRRLANAS